MIDLTPLDVRKKKGDFRRAMRGYDPAVVDDFLDLVAERLEELVRENATLQGRAEHLSEATKGYRERERAMNEALVSAQQLREEVRSQASREAELSLREAESERERIISEARREVELIREQLRRLQSQRRRFLHAFRGFLERQIEEVGLEEERLRGAEQAATLPAAGEDEGEEAPDWLRKISNQGGDEPA
ncbi:MAG: DivIVA domain-containing protein [Longimicrobiaceae bacterium]